MTDDSTPWQVLNKRPIYTSAWINLALWSVRLPDGTVIADHHVVDYPQPAVAVIPIGEDGRILMIDHYRVITDHRGWELPAGRVEPGESIDDAAQRELMEETGYSANMWATLGAYHPSHGSSNQTFHLRIARGLQRRSEPTDRNETLGLRWFSVREIREFLRGNQLFDGLSITALCWAMLIGAITETV